jgi:thiosulfate reductase cytochrome b subunit
MKKNYIYGIGERIWHWTQALSIAILLFTGFSIHLLTPDGMDFNDLYNWHIVIGFILIFNTFVGNIYFLSNHRVTQFIPYVNSEFVDNFIFQFKYYIMGRFKGQKQPFKKTRDDKLNPMQKTTYFGMLFIIIPVQIITGLLLYYYNGFAAGMVSFLGGFGVVSIIHVISAFIFMSFLIVHIYLTFLAKPFYNYYLGMITGYELETVQEDEK